MIGCRSFIGIYFQARRSTSTLQFVKNHNFFHVLSCELKMDSGKGKRIDMSWKKQNTVKQTRRAVSGQPSSSQGRGGKGELQSRDGEINNSIPLTVPEAKYENTNPGVVNVPPGPDTYPSKASNNNDQSNDANLIPPKKHSISIEVGGSLMRFIRGHGGVTQEEIEKNTGVQIIFPLSKQEDSIIIEGNSTVCVTKASEKIQIIIDKAVNGRDLDYSHFVSLPLAIHPGLVEKLVNFQNSILGVATAVSDKHENRDSDSVRDVSDEDKEFQHSTKASKVAVELKAGGQVEENITSGQQSTCKAEDADTPVKVNKTSIPLVSYQPRDSKAPAAPTELGIERSIFIKPRTFHLTVLMLKLWNKDRVKAAADVLQSVSSKVMDALNNQPVSIRLKGLDCMRGSLSKARVLYAPVEEIGGEGRLLCACEVITDAFIEAGLVIEKDVEQKLKLHATLMNTRHRKRNNRTRKLESFDARGIFQLYGSEEWGEYPIIGAHLSQRFVFDENGYYHCCASIPFPDEIQVD